MTRLEYDDRRSLVTKEVSLGMNETWIFGDARHTLSDSVTDELRWEPYFITPNGNFYKYYRDGSHELIAELDPSYYNEPQRLLRSASDPSEQPPATLAFLGNKLSIIPNDDYRGTFGIIVRAHAGCNWHVQVLQVTVLPNA